MKKRNKIALTIVLVMSMAFVGVLASGRWKGSDVEITSILEDTQ